MSENRKGFRFFAATVGACLVGILIFFADYSPQMAQGNSGQDGSSGRSASDLQIGVPGAGQIEHLQAELQGTVVLDDLPLATPAELSAHPLPFRPKNGLTDAQYFALKKAAAARGVPNSGRTARPKLAPPGSGLVQPFLASPLSGGIGKEAVSWTTDFAGLDQSGSGGGTPSDMALAVNENFVLQVVNSAIVVLDKHGNVQSGYPKSLNTFFSLSPSAFTSDPRAFYDWANHRFIVAVLFESSPFTGTNQGEILFAASATHDPRGSWFVYAVNVGASGDCPDFPTLGHDTNNWGTGATKGGFYFGFNDFTGGTNCNSDVNFGSNILFGIPKDPVYAGGGFSGWAASGFTFGGQNVDTLQPANVTDRADKPTAEFVVNSENINFGGGACSTGCNTLVVWSITNPFNGGPVFTGASLTTSHTYSLPPNADEPGCTGGKGCIDTDDTRISGQVKYHAGSLWGSLNTGVAASVEAEPIWFEVHPVTDGNGNLASLEERQEDCFVCSGFGNNGSAYYATLQPDPEGNVVMIYTYSDDLTSPVVVMTSRRVTYGDSLMNGVGSGFFLSSASYTQGRWGDYSATAPDLTIATSPFMWFAGMAVESNGNWGTIIGAAHYNLPTDQ